MSSASIGRALVILRALFDWLVQDVNYLKANPWRALEISLRARPTGEDGLGVDPVSRTPFSLRMRCPRNGVNSTPAPVLRLAQRPMSMWVLGRLRL
jgi:hypothetical protein